MVTFLTFRISCGYPAISMGLLDKGLFYDQKLSKLGLHSLEFKRREELTERYRILETGDTEGVCPNWRIGNTGSHPWDKR